MAPSPSPQKPWIQTPLIESRKLSKTAGCRIFLKLDNLQPSASFKSRGVGNVVLQAVRRYEQSPNVHRRLHFYSSSGGNAGLAAVTAATSLGYPSTVCVPTTTDEFMVAKLKAAGASEVIQHGDSWMYADTFLRETVIPEREKRGQNGKLDGAEIGVYVPPFDHEDIWDGNASLVDELAWQMPDGVQPDAIVCSVGGGGLFAGVMQGLDRVGWSGSESHKPVQVLAVETAGADSLHQSVEAGHRVILPRMTSLAKSLGAVRVCERAFDFALHRRTDQVTTLVLPDAEACRACCRLADDEHLLVEPACGVSVALCYDPHLLRRLVRDFSPDTRVVVVVCGGSDVSVDKLVRWREMFGMPSEEEQQQQQQQTQKKAPMNVKPAVLSDQSGRITTTPLTTVGGS